MSVPMLVGRQHPEGKGQFLGSRRFKEIYGVDQAYVAGAMYKGIASAELVVAMARGGFLSFYGTGGLSLDRVARDLSKIQSTLSAGESFGMNLLSSLDDPELERATVDLFLERGVRFIEASAYMQVTPDIVRFRLRGARVQSDGSVVTPRRVLAKLSRPEIAERFARPADSNVLDVLLRNGGLTAEECRAGLKIPVAEEICVEADSGGHTDQGVSFALFPAIRNVVSRVSRGADYCSPIQLGLAGGIGCPEAVAAAFVMGADFVTTGSINQCTVEAGIGDSVKDLLQDAGVQDTAYAPAGDMFELGSKVQVLKKGLLFAARANKLYELYTQNDRVEALEPQIRRQIEERFFGRGFEEVWTETRTYLQSAKPAKLREIEENPKKKLAAILKWYFVHSTRLAMTGQDADRVNFQVHCGPALGALNEHLKGTALEDWRERRVAHIGQMLMDGAAHHINSTVEDGARRAMG